MQAAVTHPDGRIERIVLSQSPCWIGSGDGCTLRLPQHGVGIRHARLDFIAPATQPDQVAALVERAAAKP